MPEEIKDVEAWYKSKLEAARKALQTPETAASLDFYASVALRVFKEGGTEKDAQDAIYTAYERGQIGMRF